MSAEMNDEKFDQWLQSVARDYNRPGDALAPADREAMWGAIEGALDAAPVASPETSSRDIVPLARRRVLPRGWQAAAAVAILAAGIGIGRLWSPQANAPAANSPVAAVTPTSEADGERVPTGTGGTAAAREATDAPIDRADSRRNPASASYDVAAMQYLTRAEALLTAFRTNEGIQTSAPMNRWARDLLGDTRLLLDSPAAEDPRRRALLEDLEMVLAQIVQLPAESSADRGLVQRSIERGAVLSRLRSTIPAGFLSGT